MRKGADFAFFGKFPTLGKVNAEYGEGHAEKWLVGQIGNFNEYCGVTKKLTDEQMDELATLIATEYHYFKVTELMLFFFRFKGGHYGPMYGVVDPLTITNKLIEFAAERRAAWTKRIQEEERKRREEDLKNSMSREEYDAIMAARNSK